MGQNKENQINIFCKKCFFDTEDKNKSKDKDNKKDKNKDNKKDKDKNKKSSKNKK